MIGYIIIRIFSTKECLFSGFHSKDADNKKRRIIPFI